MKKLIGTSLLVMVVIGNVTAVARADEVTDWNQIMLDALVAGNVGGVVATRHAAIVQSAVYDAVNGIEPRYTPMHVAPAAPQGASPRAAAIQAAYATLLKLFPAQKTSLDARRDASLATSSRDEAGSRSSEHGIAWGQTVADAIWAWRSMDGFTATPPPNSGGNAVGQWRPTPPAFAPFAAVQFASMTPWAIRSPSQFPLPAPPELGSARYATDFNEVKRLGAASSPSRTPDQTLLATFWASANGPNYMWNRVAVSLAAQRRTGLAENARILAMLNVAMADAAIAVWNAKLHHQLWRPITAIQLAETDGNPATSADSGWTPLSPTPPYPDYPSGVVGVGSAAATVLTNVLGPNTPVTIDSNGMPGVTRSFANMAAAIDEAVNARIFSGVHFRFADVDARELGTRVASYILANSFRPR